MERCKRLYAPHITHSDLDNLGITVENLRKTRALTKTGSNRQRYYAIRQMTLEKGEYSFILRNRV